MKKFIHEFKEFALKGNVMNLAADKHIHPFKICDCKDSDYFSTFPNKYS